MAIFGENELFEPKLAYLLW